MHAPAPLPWLCTGLPCGPCLPEDVDEVPVHHLVCPQIPHELQGMQQGRQRACRAAQYWVQAFGCTHTKSHKCAVRVG